ncbi:MAG: hypothetical protein GXP30_08430 [Verrucomicrobia bacterium]|nr:hypothetical protein [Verrucomicrobiota bacterium]
MGGNIYVWLCGAVLFSAGNGMAQVGVEGVPRPVAERDFEQLKSRSPFLRTLNLADTYFLRAVVSLGEESLATLYNRDTRETVVISSIDEDKNGMRLIEVSSADELGNVSVKVVLGGETMELKYDSERVAPAGKSASGHGGAKKKGKPDGKKRKGPAPEEVKRYKALSPEQQKKFHLYIRQTVKKYPDISREERGNMIRGALIRLADGHDVEVGVKN